MSWFFYDEDANYTEAELNNKIKMVNDISEYVQIATNVTSSLIPILNYLNNPFIPLSIVLTAVDLFVLENALHSDLNFYYEKLLDLKIADDNTKYHQILKREKFNVNCIYANAFRAASLYTFYLSLNGEVRDIIISLSLIISSMLFNNLSLIYRNETEKTRAKNMCLKKRLSDRKY